MAGAKNTAATTVLISLTGATIASGREPFKLRVDWGNSVTLACDLVQLHCCGNPDNRHVDFSPIVCRMLMAGVSRAFVIATTVHCDRSAVANSGALPLPPCGRLDKTVGRSDDVARAPGVIRKANLGRSAEIL